MTTSREQQVIHQRIRRATLRRFRDEMPDAYARIWGEETARVHAEAQRQDASVAG